jgi:amino acid transporter
VRGVGDLIGGTGWGNVMIVAVLGGTLASLLAAIVSAGRISYAMGRDRTFPRWFANVNPRFRTPWNATILFGLLNILFLWGTTGYPARAGGLWLRRTLLWSRFHAVVVPSGWRTRVQPIRWIIT